MHKRAEGRMDYRGRSGAAPETSIDLRPGTLHDLGPFGRVLAYRLRIVLGRAAGQLVADLAEPRLEHRRDDRLVDGGVEPVDNGPGHPRRSDHAAPGAR